MNLLGMHDREGRHIPPVGGWCLDTVALHQNPVAQDYTSMRADINWLVRLNWGYGSVGTFPTPNQATYYVDAAIEYIMNSRGAYGFILGNEPNHENERPGGAVLHPHYVAALFVKIHGSVKSANSKIQVMPPPIAPYHASPIDWLYYFRSMYEEIERLGSTPDGIPIHAYLRGKNPDDLRSTAKMASPLTGQHSSFRTYQDALKSLPSRSAQAPAFITEFNPLDGWEDRDAGIIVEGVRELKEWNADKSHTQVRSFIMYRWPKYDENAKWAIEGKNGVVQDFNNAVREAEYSHQVSLPVVTAPTPVVVAPTPSPSVSFRREIETDASNYGVKVVPFPEAGLRDGDYVWVAERVERLHEAEGEGRRHFYFETVDDKGNRLVGVPILVEWSTATKIVHSEAKPGEPWSANYPFTPGKNAFNATVVTDVASDKVNGAGMGEDTPGGFNAGVHSSITVRFVRHRYTKQPIPVTPSLPETPKPVITPVPFLVHPVLDAEWRKVTQIFGVNEHKYKQFKVDGVALRGHNGVDFGTPLETPIVAVADGRVVEVYDESPKGYGKYVKLSHTWGETLYAHLQQWYVDVGDWVKAGQMLGLSGNTGNSTGPHLHFGMRVSPFNRADGWGGYINPLPYLQRETEPVPAPMPISGISKLLDEVAREVDISWQLLVSVAWAESSFNPKADSGVARGLMQITTPTWEEWGRRIGLPEKDGRVGDIWNARDNARVGANYLKFLIQYYGGDVYKALWAYNWGPGNVNAGGEPPPETVEFANKVVHGRDLLYAIDSLRRTP